MLRPFFYLSPFVCVCVWGGLYPAARYSENYVFWLLIQVQGLYKKER